MEAAFIWITLFAGFLLVLLVAAFVADYVVQPWLDRKNHIRAARGES